MLEEGKVTSKQLVQLIFISRIVVTLTYFPILVAPPKNQDVWLAELISFPMMLILSIPLYLLWERFPHRSIIQYSEIITGKLGKFIGVLYVWFFLHMAAINLSQFNAFLSGVVMPETPILFFSISLTLLCAYAARTGIEVLSRLTEIIVPLIIIAVVIIAALLVKDMDLKAFLPVMEEGFFPVLYGGLAVSCYTTEIIGIAMILPYLNDHRKARSVFIIGFALIVLFFLVITISLLATMGIEVAKNHTFPFFTAVRLVSIGNFLERVEAIHMGLWILGVFVKISFYYYLATLGLGQLGSFKDYKPLVLPMGALIVPLSILISPSLVELREFTSYKIFTWYALFFIMLIPLVLLVLAMIRKKGENKK